jgi:uncharacterized membrane protein YcjF (UPF0283 family)
VFGLDQNGAYVVWALAITIAVLAGYALYLWSRLSGLRKREAARAQADDYSGRNVSAAAPIATTAQAASSANGPSTP